MESFSIPLELTLTKADAAHHTSGEVRVNHPNLKDESTDGFFIQATLDKVVNGEGSDLNTFIGFSFRFEGIDDRRRFKRVEVTIRFEDVEKPGFDDPAVIGLWPDGEHVWKQTPVEQEGEKVLEPTIKGGSEPVANTGLSGRWSRKQKFTFTTQATFSGNALPIKSKVRTRNAVRLTLNESRQGRTGVVSQIKTGVLLARQKEGVHSYRAYFEVEAKADMRFRWLRGIKKLVSPPSQPAHFSPDQDYRAIVKAIPDLDMVRKYGDVISWTELDPVRRLERGEDGQGWKETSGDKNAEQKANPGVKLAEEKQTGAGGQAARQSGAN